MNEEAYIGHDASGEEVKSDTAGNMTVNPTDDLTEQTSQPNEPAEQNQEPVEPAQNNPEVPRTGIRPEFIETMDSYEAFFDEYITFMKKYAESDGTDIGLLADYTKYMSKYVDMMEKFEQMEDEELSTEELQYYLEVQTRISQKLLEIQP